MQHFKNYPERTPGSPSKERKKVTGKAGRGGKRKTGGEEEGNEGKEDVKKAMREKGGALRHFLFYKLTTVVHYP